MTELTRQFRDVPYELFPGLIDQPLRIDVQGQGANPDQAVAHSFRQRDPSTATLRALDRVAWASMAVDGNRHVITISRTYDPVADTEPCYYLPWIPNYTLGMKLKPSRKVAEGERFAEYQGRDHVDGETWERATAQRAMLQGLADGRRTPRLFFTAMLTGCTVHIDGLPTEPNVYHGNAAAVADPPGALNSAHLPTRKRFQRRLRRIDRALDEGYQRMPWNDGGPSSCVSVLDYDFRRWNNDMLAAKWGHGADLLTDELRAQGAQIKDMRVIVFGMKNLHDHWVFYGQRVYQYRRPNVLANVAWGALGYPPRQIWPGHGHIQL